jgi:hypothetical protein
MSSSNIKLSIILIGEENWHGYIDGAETLGRKSDIWDLIYGILLSAAPHIDKLRKPASIIH